MPLRRALVAALLTTSSALVIFACVGDEPTVASGAEDGSTDGGAPGDGGAGLGDASACEADTARDPSHCGACGHACGAEIECIEGVCANEPRDIAAGGDFSCMVRGDGTVYCWGDNLFAQLGVAPGSGDTACGTRPCRFLPTKVAGITDAVNVSAGLQHACVTVRGGNVLCWGRDIERQIGAEPVYPPPCSYESPDASVLPLDCQPSPARVEGFPESASSVTLGSIVGCARTVSGALRCWGAQASYGLASSPNGARIDGGAVDVAFYRAAIDAYACAALDDRSVSCWGRTAPHAESCYDPTGNQVGCTTTPTAVPGVTGVTAVAATKAEALALTEQGTILTWPPYDGAPITTLTLPTSVAAIRAGNTSAFAIGDDGVLYGWLADNMHQLAGSGDGGAPGAIKLPKAVRRVAAGYTHVLALLVDGTLWAWGGNFSGQLGHPSGSEGDVDSCAFVPGDNAGQVAYRPYTTWCNATPTPIALP